MGSFYLAIDMDGTIVEHEFPEIGKPVPGAIEWMKKFQEAGAKLILWTMRDDHRVGEGRENGPVLSEAVNYCHNNGIEFYAVNDNPTQSKWTQSRKVYANYYLDDAAIGCPLIPGTKSSRPMVDWSITGPLVYQLISEYNK